MKRPRILLADDHQMFAEGMKRLLEPEFEVVGCLDNALELPAAAERTKPDVIIVDVSMPGMNGIDAVRHLKNNRAKVIFLSMHAEPAFVTEAFRGGASGYVVKSSDGDDLIKAVRECFKGGTYISPHIAKNVMMAARNGGEKKAGISTLTSRQREVLQLLSEGHAAKEIAHLLGISVSTVEFHKMELMKRLDLHSTAELVRYAIGCGLSSLSQVLLFLGRFDLTDGLVETVVTFVA
ncbi:MAG: response regulator transcription factor [Acidobacteria bacterium]|nr:response regulator transcription factor [Acidobacteriota bacterium]